MIYLNNASTTPVKPEVIEVISDVLKNNWGNPSDKYELGYKPRLIMNESREIIANKINANPDEIIFVSSGSAANALALNDRYFYSSNIEHSSIMNNKTVINSLTTNVHGEVVFDETYNGDNVSIMACNNEIGTINDIKNISYCCNIIHSDCVQYFPYKKIDVKDWNVDMISLSGHKIGAPAGIGVLYINKGSDDILSLISGSQEQGLFAGTENVAYIAGLAKAVELLDYSRYDIIEELRNYFEECITQNISDVYINGVNSDRMCHISNMCFKRCDSQQLQALLDMDGIYCSTGSACQSYISKPSHVLKAIGLNDYDAKCCLRFSFSEYNTKEEIDFVVDKINNYVKFLRDI